MRVPKPNIRVKYDWQQFANDTDIQQRYTLTVRNRFQILENETNEERYNRFVKANEQTMEECVPKKERVRKSLRAKHPDIIASREAAVDAHDKFIQEETSENREKWKEALQNLYNTYDRLKEEDLMGKIE